MGKSKNKKKTKTKTKLGWRGQVALLLILLTGVVFMQTSLVLMIGMLPTVVASLLDRTGRGTMAITVGAMNLAGCSPFLIDLWMTGHTLEKATVMVSDPRTITVMYGAAALGYLINWATGGIVENVMTGQSRQRLQAIEKRQEKLKERWGEEVSGEIPVDEYGFPLHPDGNKKKT